MQNKNKSFYQALKKGLYERQKSPFNPVLGLKNQTGDILILGFRRNEVYKIIMPGTDQKQIDYIIEYWRSRAVWNNLRIYLYLIFPTKDLNINDYKTELIKIND